MADSPPATDVDPSPTSSFSESEPRAQALFRTSRKPPRKPSTRRRYSSELEAAIRAGEIIDEEKFALTPEAPPRRRDEPLRLRQEMRVNWPGEPEGRHIGSSRCDGRRV